jgi:hypothetical protein
MKLKFLATNNQRDPQWASTLLGFNTNSAFTIGMYGCLITAFGNYIGKNPFEVNDILKSGGGFVAGGGDFIWSKSSLLGLNQVYQSPYYADAVSPQGLTKMKAFLDAGQPLITHIDFNPATIADEMHWVLICGYDGDKFYALDSWTGEYINMDVYGGVARAVLEYRAYDKILEKESGVMVSVESHVFEELVRKSTITDKVALKLNVEVSEAVILADLDKMITLEDVVFQKDKQLTEAQAKVATLEGKVTEKDGELAKVKEDLAVLTETVDKAIADNQVLSAQVQQLKKDCKVPVLSGWKLNLWKWLQKQ